MQRKWQKCPISPKTLSSFNHMRSWRGWHLMGFLFSMKCVKSALFILLAYTFWKKNISSIKSHIWSFLWLFSPMDQKWERNVPGKERPEWWGKSFKGDDCIWGIWDWFFHHFLLWNKNWTERELIVSKVNGENGITAMVHSFHFTLSSLESLQPGRGESKNGERHSFRCIKDKVLKLSKLLDENHPSPHLYVTALYSKCILRDLAPAKWRDRHM